MRVIELFNKEYGFDAEVKVSNESIERLSSFLAVVSDEAFQELEYEVAEALSELDSDGKLKDENISQEIVFATEDKRDASTYDSIAFELNFSGGVGEIKYIN